MKKLVTICAVLTMIVAVSSPAFASVSLSGTFTGVDSDTGKDNGNGNDAYAINRTAAGTFYWSAGPTVRITGNVDVRGLTSGSYLQIGLVDKQQADLSLDTYGWGGYMFNNSALATFYAGTRNYATLTDDNARNSASLYNPTGATPGVFNFTLDILSNGTMDLTLHGSSDASTTYTYGQRNWWDGWSGWSGGELANGSYLISQLWIDTGNTTNLVSAGYNITGTSIPAPGAILLGSIGVGLVGWLRKRRTL